MSIPPGTDTEKSSIGGVPLLNGIAQLLRTPQSCAAITVRSDLSGQHSAMVTT